MLNGQQNSSLRLASPEAEGSGDVSSDSVGYTSVRSFPFVKSVAGVKMEIGECWVGRAK